MRWPHGGMLLVAASLACVACGKPPAPADGAIARVGDSIVTGAEFELYISHNLVVEEDAESEISDRVQSRMLDALIDERLFLAEAVRRGLEVSELEIRAYLGAAEDPESAAGSHQWVRQRLMIHKLLDAEAREHPPPTEADIAARVAEVRSSGANGRRLRLRALRLESGDDAKNIYALIQQRRLSFAAAVATHGSGPDQGVPLDMSWSRLPEEVRAVLADLDPGQVGRPVESNGETYLFQLDAWLDEPDAEHQLERAREELERERRKQIHVGLLQRLREATPVEIHEDQLPFRYVREDRS